MGARTVLPALVSLATPEPGRDDTVPGSCIAASRRSCYTTDRMTQRDPDPASLPETIPLLSYERQTDDGAMDWVLRFVGAWVICVGTAYTLFYVVVCVASYGLTLEFMFRDLQRLSRFASLLCSLSSIIFGIAIARRYRYGFYGSLIVLAVAPLLELAFDMSAGAGRVGLFFLPSRVLPVAALFAALLSVLRRADAKGVLQPVHVNRLGSPQDGGSLGFLISRTGWVFLAQGGVVLVDLAMLPVFSWAGFPSSPWSLDRVALVGTYLAVGTCGLLLCQRRAWALWLLAGTLVTQVTMQEFLMWQYYYSTTGNPIFTITAVYHLNSVLITTASIVMLCLLARKAARTGI